LRVLRAAEESFDLSIEISGLVMNDEYRTGRVRYDGCGDAAQQMPHETGVTVRTKNDQTHLVLFSGVDDPFPGWRSLHGQTLCPKTRVPRERRTEFCSLFGCFANLIRCIGIEVTLGDRLEADIGRLPYAEHERIATSRELTPRALNG
jgi:hypothetical protein